jgi:hypothetical protein
VLVKNVKTNLSLSLVRGVEVFPHPAPDEFSWLFYSFFSSDNNWTNQGLAILVGHRIIIFIQG